MKLFSIPNLLTLGNLLCGCLAIVFAFEVNLVWSAYLVGIACVFDFLDGFVARALKIHSPIGKDLDSLADMVTFGVVPGVVMFQILKWSIPLVFGDVDIGLRFLVDYGDLNSKWNIPDQGSWMRFIPYLAFLFPIFSALRLAKFNNDSRQSDSFIGVPTPANSIFICSIPLILHFNHAHMSVMSGMQFASNSSDLNYYEANGVQQFMMNWTTDIFGSWKILTGIVFLFSFLLISEIPLFALKFKKFGWKGNEIRYVFLALCLMMIVLLKFIAMPLIIVLYILMSVVNNMIRSNSSNG
ncbi:MAG TPA: CDP-alcohol phosphatidyltransferase family protein [Bacteroidia bacterium]|nr:CDP-alcohol phosphatidyltransferase family protein [Bacteroidia bacterium]